MGWNTKIGYCHATLSPWYGCTKISPGCERCFAERWAKRTGIVEWGPGKARRLASEHAWRQPLKWNERAAKVGTRYRVLTDLCDVFDQSVSITWRNRFACLRESTPNLDWLLLTKRIQDAALWAKYRPFMPNVWLGVSVCTQAEADEKIPVLLSIAATKHWVSIEPMLEGINLESAFSVCDANGEPSGPRCKADGSCVIDWVVCGGETGPGARPLHPDWVWSLRDQCQNAGAAFWFKAWGSREPLLKCGYDKSQKAGGNLLDSRKWEQVPK